ncbi:hypothetical protein B0H11DRAFT_2189558 [Mycena galericulata]|nr:hypothetical protein B0H11DRAFT_2189558 [Mycena galericulata]
MALMYRGRNNFSGRPLGLPGDPEQGLSRPYFGLPPSRDPDREGLRHRCRLAANRPKWAGEAHGADARRRLLVHLTTLGDDGGNEDMNGIQCIWSVGWEMEEICYAFHVSFILLVYAFPHIQPAEAHLHPCFPGSLYTLFGARQVCVDVVLGWSVPSVVSYLACFNSRWKQLNRNKICLRSASAQGTRSKMGSIRYACASGAGNAGPAHRKSVLSV